MSPIFHDTVTRRIGLVTGFAALLGCSLAADAHAAQLTLRWSDTSGNETGFRIERASMDTGPFTEIATTPAGVTSYTDNALADASAYFYRIRAFNNTGESAYSNTAYAVTPPPPNSAPTISVIADQAIAEDGATAPLAFTVADAQTPASDLVVHATSGNALLVPASGLVLAGSGGNRTLLVRPAPDLSGVAPITVEVSDGALRASTTFLVTVAAVNDTPTISAIASRTLQAGSSSGTAGFTVDDVETSAGSLSVSASSSDPTLLPASNIVFGGSGSMRTLAFVTPPSPGGSVVVTVRVSDGAAAATTSFVVTLAPANTAPTVTSIPSLTVRAGTSSSPLAFTVGDLETAATSLVVTATSSDAAVLPSTALSLAGTGPGRTLTINPLPDTPGGSSTVTLRVSDGLLATTTSLVVTVDATNVAPTISSIASQSLAMNATTGALAFTISDTQTPAANLTLITNASNPALVPLSNIILGGSGANRTVTVRPAFNTTGWSTIWLKVSDGTLTQTTSFVVNVSAVLTYGDIGSPLLAGSQTASGTTITLSAGGTDIWGGTDQFRFGWQLLEGDSEMTVRVANLTASHAWAKAGLMYRESTDANAAYVFLCVTPGSGLALQYRTAAGVASAQKAIAAGSPPRWLKLTRSGDTFYAFHSGDGVTWDMLEFVTVDLSDGVPAGLAATSHTNATTTTATFEGFGVD